MTVYVADAQAPPREEAWQTFEARDPSLTRGWDSFRLEVALHPRDMVRLFLKPGDLETFGTLLFGFGKGRVVTHPRPTTSCSEKASLLVGVEMIPVVKAVFFESAARRDLIVAVVPHDSGRVDVESLAAAVGEPGEGALGLARSLPGTMVRGTCSPFVPRAHLAPDGPIRRIVFDDDVVRRRHEQGGFDDFALPHDGRLSLHVNYASAYMLLASTLADVVTAAPLTRGAQVDRPGPVVETPVASTV